MAKTTAKRTAVAPVVPTTPDARLVGWVRKEFESMQRFRTSINYDNRLENCLRQRNGVYPPDQMAAITMFGGSSVFARLTANKCRGAAAMLREIYIANERPWEVDPTPIPSLPADPIKAVLNFLAAEGLASIESGQELDMFAFNRKADMLMTEAIRVMREEAKAQARLATRYIDDLLVEGGFYEALAAFIEDFVTYPLAVLRGPVAVMKTRLTWGEDGIPVMKRTPVLTWQRVDPQDFWWTPGVSRIEDAGVIQRLPMTRAELNGMVGLPGYKESAVRGALREYGEGGLREPASFGWDRKATLENRNTAPAEYQMIDGLLFSGPVQGKTLQELGVEGAKDADLDYLTQVLIVGQHLLKVQVDPNPRQRLSYYVAAYEPVPNSLVGNALPELIADLQQSCNASLRALINNLSMASGPQVSVDLNAIDDPDDSLEMYPWKRWKFRSDPQTPNAKPIEFFQPNSNAAELMQVYMMFSNLADEVSAVPRYLTGNERVGGAGRTASGLSMLMQNSGRVMESIASAIDGNIIEPAVMNTYDLVMLTGPVDDGIPLRGDETIRTRGATNAKAKEADKMRLMELLNLTQNPIDMQIIGMEGRAQLLRRVMIATGTDMEHLVGRDAGTDNLLAMLGGLGNMAMPMGGAAPPGVSAPVQNGAGGPPGPAQPGAPATPGQNPAGEMEGAMRPRGGELGPSQPRMR